jgi:hypothetical protein
MATVDGLPDIEYPVGAYKVSIVLASESEDSAVQMVEVAIQLGSRKHPPPPLECFLWRADFKDTLLSREPESSDG